MRQWALAPVGCTIGLLTVIAAGCGSSGRASPTDPDSVVSPPAQISGWWEGEYRLTECRGERHCVLLIGKTYPFQLRLEQTGASFRGVFSAVGTVDVSGTAAQTGEVLLTGTAPAASSLDALGRIDLKQLVVGADPSASGLVGSFSLENYPAANPESEPVVFRSGAIVSAVRRAPTVPGSVIGRWSGQYVVRECIPVVWLQCWPDALDQVLPFDLSLVESGPEGLLGELVLRSSRIPVHGQVSGSALIVEGALTESVSGGTTIVRLAGWTSTADEFGRLRGRFEYVNEYHPSQGQVHFTSYVAELWNVLYRVQ